MGIGPDSQQPGLGLASTVESLRTKDEKGKNGETLPEKQTLNSAKVVNFLRANGIVSNNIEKVFSLDVGIKMTGDSPTDTEKSINSVLSESKVILDKYKATDLMLEQSDSVVSGKVANLQTPPSNMSAMEAGKVLQAFSYLNLMRDYSRRLMVAEEKVKDNLDDHKKGVGIMATVQEKLSDARENWDKWSGGQKIAFAGVALLGAIWMLKSENETVKKIKEVLKTGLMIGGGAWFLNKGTELFTGHTAWDWATDRTRASTKQAKFFVESYRTDEKGAEVLSQSMVMLGDMKMMDLIDKYQKAKADSSQKIEGTKMKPDEAYRAMDIFFKKYNEDGLRKEYMNYTPPISYSQAAADQMARDPGVKMEGAITTRVYDAAADKFKEGYNYLALTGPASWVGEKYRSIFGKDANKLEMEEFVKKFDGIAKNDAEFNTIVETKLCAKDREAGKSFIDTSLTGVTDVKYGLKYKQVGNYLYVISDKNLAANLNDNKAVSNTIQGAMSQSDAFLANKFGVNMTEVPKRSEMFGSVYVVGSTTMKYLTRYKIK